MSYIIARDYIAAGISVIPVMLDGSKRPATEWNEFRERFATPAELERWFDHRRDRYGIGVVTGLLSGGLEVLDLDVHADTIFPAWKEKLSPTIRGKLCVIETGGLGYHAYFRCEEVAGNVKLAKSADGTETLIETRGEGGFVVAPGSALRVHKSGSPYVQVAGQPLPELPVMTTDERRLMFQAAASFDERADRLAEHVAKAKRRIAPETDTDDSTPWGAFDAHASWADVLGPSGWSSVDGETWTRPGKTSGTSAKVVIAENGCEVLTVFSANAGPLSPSGSHRTWGRFGAFAALYHGGDRRAAARAVRAAGYGVRAAA